MLKTDSGRKQLQVGDSQLVELLSGTEPQQLCLVCVHLEPIAAHHSSIRSTQETKRCTVVDADAAGALMYNCVSSAYECALCSKTCTGYDSKQLSSVQQETATGLERSLVARRKPAT